MGLTWRIVSVVILLHIPGFLADGESVKCIHKNICALRTSVVLKCIHSNPNMTPDFWFSYKQKSKWSDETQPEDLTKDSDYAGRLEYPDHDTSLRIKDLKLTDSGEYQLMFRSEAGATQIGPTVTLTVADVQLEMKTDQSGETVALTCNTTCRLTEEPSVYYWYKDRKYTNKFTTYRNPQPLVLNRADAGIYTCSVSSHNDAKSSSAYVFVENAVKITYAGSHYCALESSSVEFPCNFSRPKDLTVTKSTWIKVGARDLQYNDRIVYAGDNDGTCTLRINNVRKSDSGKYYFQLTHSKGLTPGSELTLDVTGSDDGPANVWKYVAVGQMVLLVLILVAGALWMWRRKSTNAALEVAGERGQVDDAQADPTYMSLKAPSADVYSSIQFRTH